MAAPAFMPQFPSDQPRVGCCLQRKQRGVAGGGDGVVTISGDFKMSASPVHLPSPLALLLSALSLLYDIIFVVSEVSLLDSYLP